MSVSLTSPLLDTSQGILEFRSRTRDTALQEIATHLAAGGCLRDPELLREALLRRERFASTATGKGLAFPNARTLAAKESRLVLGRSSRGLHWKSADPQPVQLVCAVISPAEWSEEMHHESLARVMSALRLQRQRQRLLDAPGLAGLREVWKELLG